MSKIIFLGAPAHGHLNPTLPVVQELVRRGEQVVYYNTEEFRVQIERTGAVFRAYPDAAINSTAINKSLENGDLVNFAELLFRATKQLLPYLLDDLPQHQPDLIVLDSMAVWGQMAATILKVRAAGSVSHFIIDVASMTSSVKWSEGLRHLGQAIPHIPMVGLLTLQLMSRYGRAPFPANQPLFPMRGGVNIMFTTRELHPPTPAIDDGSFRFVGPSITAQARDESFPYAALEHDKVIYISLGTVHTARGEFYRACFEAFGDYPAQFVLSVGKDTNIAELRDIPQNFIVRQTVPQLAVLERATVFITHGGLNSIHEGLYYGVPLLMIPQQLEQLLNARRIEKLGAGLVIDKMFVKQPITAGDLRAALETVLTNNSYRAAGAALRQTLRDTGGYRQAADEIQGYLKKTV